MGENSKAFNLIIKGGGHSGIRPNFSHFFQSIPYPYSQCESHIYAIVPPKRYKGTGKDGYNTLRIKVLLASLPPSS